MKKRFRVRWWAICGSLLFTGAAMGEEITFAMTTTQEASGVAAAISSALQEAFPDRVFSYTVSGTSQALRSIQDGLLPFGITHNSEKERELVKRGGHQRQELFKNDFLLVGPGESGLACSDIPTCLKKTADQNLPFLSRGDASGTHLYELESWYNAGIEPANLSRYSVASGGAANGLRICAIQACFTIVDESSVTGNAGGLSIVARDVGVNLYALVYSKDFALGSGEAIIPWIILNVPGLAEEFNYRSR